MKKFSKLQQEPTGPAIESAIQWDGGNMQVLKIEEWDVLQERDMVIALPRELMEPYLGNGRLAVLPFELGITMDVYGIVTRRGHQLSPGAEAMLATLREVAARRHRAP